MQCPVDSTTLAMADRQGVEIDYCPQCRGVWLDRGELDKLMQREAAAPVPARSRHDDDDDDWVPLGGKKRKRKSFLSEIFEFGD
jgi:Zn-finger nucleic acid-binding protein